MDLPVFEVEQVHLELTAREVGVSAAPADGLEGVLKLAGALRGLPEAHVVPEEDVSPDWAYAAQVAAHPSADVHTFTAEELAKLDLTLRSELSTVVEVDPEGPLLEEDQLLLRTEDDEYVVLSRKLVPYLRHVDTVQLPDAEGASPKRRWTYERRHRVAIHRVGEYASPSAVEAADCAVVYREIALESNSFGAGDIAWRAAVTPFTASVDVATSFAVLAFIAWADDDDG